MAVAADLCGDRRGERVLRLWSRTGADLAAELLQRRLPTLRRHGRILIGEIILVCLSTDSADAVIAQGEAWLEAGDPMLAIAAATAASALVSDYPAARRLWQRSLEHEDESVRKAALEHLKSDRLTDRDRETLADLRAAARQPYHCTRCGTQNPDRTACEKCHFQAPETTTRIGQLIEPAKPREPARGLLDFMLPSRQRRIRRRNDSWL